MLLHSIDDCTTINRYIRFNNKLISENISTRLAFLVSAQSHMLMATLTIGNGGEHKLGLTQYCSSACSTYYLDIVIC
jgi:hypothetical protein